MKKLVFICRANVFRSQIAEAIFNSDPVPGWYAVSYGTSTKEYGLEGVTLLHSGNGIEYVIEDLKQKGINIANNTTKQLLPENLNDADKVIVMSEVFYTPPWLIARNDERWEVTNPSAVDQSIAKETIELLEDKINSLKKTLQTKSISQ